MVYIVEINTNTVVDTIEDARQIGGAISLILGEERGVRIYSPEHRTYVPVTEPKLDRSKITRGRQEAAGTALTLANKVSQVMGLTPDLFVDLIVLDEGIRTWNVDYEAMVKVIRTCFPGDAEKLVLFKDIVQEVLAAAALRGISLK